MGVKKRTRTQLQPWGLLGFIQSQKLLNHPDILDGAPIGAWSLKPFITFYRNQVGNCDMDELENCNIQSYGINVQKTLNTPNKCFYLAHFIVGDVPPYKCVALREVYFIII